jgi:hypothetical protein
MLDFVEKLYHELVEKLENAEEDNNLLTLNTDTRFEWIVAAINQLKEKLKTYVFTDTNEEIHFFKSMLPGFLSTYIYQTEKLEWESARPVLTSKTKPEFLNRQFRKIDDFFEENFEFLKYYRSGKTNLDPFYFLRDGGGNREKTDWMSSIMDSSFCTVYTVKVATFSAYSRLQEELRCFMAEDQEQAQVSMASENKLEWTAPKMGLVELIYALHEMGVFNNGKAGLGKIMRFIEKIFSVSLGNTSKAFQQLLSRKMSYTSFIDKMKDKLLQRIDRIEDRHIK